MEKVIGIGGFFFKSKSPTELNSWYEENLGIREPDDGYDKGSWWQDEGPTVFGAEREENPDYGHSGQTWRINFRVRDLDAMVGQLRAGGIKVEVDPEVFPNGRFAHLCDPEGNQIELWEPAGTDAVRPTD